MVFRETHCHLKKLKHLKQRQCASRVIKKGWKLKVVLESVLKFADFSFVLGTRFHTELMTMWDFLHPVNIHRGSSILVSLLEKPRVDSAEPQCQRLSVTAWGAAGRLCLAASAGSLLLGIFFPNVLEVPPSPSPHWGLNPEFNEC